MRRRYMYMHMYMLCWSFITENFPSINYISSSITVGATVEYKKKL